jgi:hypothetical protein
MKRLLLLMILLPVFARAQKTDPPANGRLVFSGKWTLDIRNTDFGQIPESILPREFEINQKSNAIVIQAKVYDKQMTQHYFTETISFDGTTSEVITYSGNKRLVTLKWNDDNKGFVLSVRLLMADGQSGSTFTENWSLDDEGKTLVLDRVATQADDFSLKGYYDKKK